MVSRYTTFSENTFHSISLHMFLSSHILFYQTSFFKYFIFYGSHVFCSSFLFFFCLPFFLSSIYLSTLVISIFIVLHMFPKLLFRLARNVVRHVCFLFLMNAQDILRRSLLTKLKVDMHLISDAK